jgi:DNA invertase Pin-like site-specific DNA recombinase
MPRHSSQTVAFSYIRFSSKKQADGDSLRRQKDGRAEAYCKRRGWRLSPETYEDLGVSAYHGKNALVGNLAEFLQAIKAGTVKPGSALVVESLDRISRQGIDEGYDLIKSILKAGILLVTLSPEREFGSDATRSLSKGALEIQLILERAAEESERKGERVAAARQQERDRIRERGELVTKRLPAWITQCDGKPVLIPDRASAVREVFRLAGAGYGVPSIVGKLTTDKVPPIGRSGRWVRSYVTLLLGDRRVLGEYQPYKGGRPQGEPIKGYYPAAVSEAEWLAARAGVGQRKRTPGRLGKARVNVFAGLIRHARDGDTYQMLTTHTTMLVNRNGVDGAVTRYSIPYDPFERAIRSCLKEIDPREVLGESEGGDDAADLETLLDGVGAELAEASAFMASRGFSVTIGQRVTELEAKKKELEDLLASARHEAEHPMARTWQDAQNLIGDLDDAPDPRDARLRLRSALRRITESVQLLVVPRGRVRLVAVQFHFRQGTRRDYLIVSRTPGNWSAGSLADVVRGGDLDLRDQDHALALEQELLALDLDTLP